MAKLIKPELFSDRFKLDPKVLSQAGLLDRVLNSDTRLFIDPLLIPKSKNQKIKRKGLRLLRDGFTNVLRLLDVSEQEGDVAWKAAFKTLNLDERPETGLGYGGSSTSGSSRPAELRQAILRTAKKIIDLGQKDPDVIPLMGLFEEGVGPDTLSDMASNLILPALCEITSDFCATHAVKTERFGTTFGNTDLPRNPLRPAEPVILVPRDILRDLPLATDWSDVSKVIWEIDEIREAVNRLFANWSKATITEKKTAIKNLALKDAEVLQRIIAALANASDSYDEKADLDGLFTFRRVLTENREKLVGLVGRPKAKSQATLRATVLEIISQFRTLVEDNNMWELLWYGDTPRRERAAQLLFFAVANVMCAVNNVDISPETNSGGGPVDFKFSTGFSGHVLVEIKLSTGQVEHGYTKQLEVYKKASKDAAGIFLVIDVGGIKNKMRTIEAARNAAVKAGSNVSDIEYIDARRKKSASKV